MSMTHLQFYLQTSVGNKMTAIFKILLDLHASVSIANKSFHKKTQRKILYATISIQVN